MIWTILICVVVAACLFGLGWATGFRVGYAEGDGVWRRQLDPKSNKVVTIDKRGNILKLTDKEQASLTNAISDFKEGKPAKVDIRGKK